MLFIKSQLIDIIVCVYKIQVDSLRSHEPTGSSPFPYRAAKSKIPKLNLFAGNSDTLKREPSESVGNKLPCANRRTKSIRTGAKSKKARTIYDPYGGLPFPTFGVSLGKEKSLAYRRSHFSVRSESDGIAKNERQLWVQVNPYGVTIQQKRQDNI